MSIWTEDSIRDEFAELHNIRTTSGKDRVSDWMHEAAVDIASRIKHPYFLIEGKKQLAASTRIHSLQTAAPDSAPTLALSGSGKLTASTAYQVKYSFYESSTGIESEPSAAASATTTASGEQIDVTALDVSTDPNVTSRFIYLKKGAGNFLYHSEVANNTATTATIDADVGATVKRQPVHFPMVYRLAGAPFFNATDVVALRKKPKNQIMMLYGGNITDGSPTYYDEMGKAPLRIFLDKTLSAAQNIEFDAYRLPHAFFGEPDRALDFPIELKSLLRSGMVKLYYEYFDLDGQESKADRYDQRIENYEAEEGTDQETDEYVRDVEGDSEGFEI